MVWHTTYTGASLPEMKASFGADISKLNKPTSVWMDDATYKRRSGTATFNAKETAQVTATLSQVGSMFQKINANQLRSFLQLQEEFKGTLGWVGLKTYNNTKVRAGQKISNPRQHAVGYAKHVETTIQKQVDKAKSVKGKEKYTKMQKEYVREVKKYTMVLTNTLTFQNLLVDAKMQIVNKLNSVKGLTKILLRLVMDLKW